MSLWSERALPWLIEKSCKSPAILAERQRWIPRAHGRVLEVGVGSGLNLAFYDPARVEEVVGIDPSPALLGRAAARVPAARVKVDLVCADAEQLPFATASFESAIVTYTLCSIPDPARALGELRRVLAPGGEVFFVEHGIAPDPGVRRWQRWLTPMWRRAGGGCRLDRDPAALLRAAHFELELATAYTEGVRWLSYTYEGVART